MHSIIIIFNSHSLVIFKTSVLCFVLLCGIKVFPSYDVHSSNCNIKISLLAESLVVLLWTYSGYQTPDGPLALVGWWAHLLIFAPQQVTSALRDPWLSLWICSMQSLSCRLSEYASLWPFCQIALRWTRLPSYTLSKMQRWNFMLSVSLFEITMRLSFTHPVLQVYLSAFSLTKYLYCCGSDCKCRKHV